MPRARKSAGRTAGRKNVSNVSARTARAGKRGTDAVSILKHQHGETRKLFQDVAEVKGEERRRLFLRLADVLAAHVEVEERFLYPETVRVEELANAAREAVEEHLVVKRLLADLLERDLEDAVFDAKLRVLESAVIRHEKEEEASFLPRARRRLGPARLEEMGREIERSFQELMKHEPRRRVPGETEAATVLH